MGATPQPDNLASKIAALSERIDELERKTLASLSVTVGTVRRLEVSQTSGVRIRDSLGSDVFSNNNTSGWGTSSPVTMVPMHMSAANGLATVQTTTVDTTYREKWLSRVVITHPVVSGYILHQVSGATATGQWRLVLNNPGTGTDVVIFESVVRGQGGSFDSVSYTIPQSHQNQVRILRFDVRLLTGTGGVDWCAASPHSMLFQGD